jgi:hypothetical protein
MINVVTLHTEEQQLQLVANINPIHKRIIAYVGKEALRIYGLPLDFELKKIDSSTYKKLSDWRETLSNMMQGICHLCYSVPRRAA